MACPVCSLEEETALDTGRRRFRRCSRCGFIRSELVPDDETARRRYLLHRNDIGDQGYRDFLTRILDRGLEFLGEGGTVLDWGSGPRPVTVELLERRGIRARAWDSVFAPDAPPQKESLDLVFCIETAEHFADPAGEFRALAECLRCGGRAVLHTRFAPAADGDFLSWWYQEDITHVSFYSEMSLRLLAASASLVLEAVEEEKLAVLRKPFPVLVAGGINMDIEGRPAASLLSGDSNPGTVRVTPGGCGRNMAENLGRLGIGVELVGPLGDDAFGESLRAQAAAAGIGVSGTGSVAGESTSSYISILDDTGDMALAVSGMGIFDRFSPDIAEKFLERACAAASKRSAGPKEAARGPFSALLLDGNLLPETALLIRRAFPGIPAWFDPVSTAKARRAARFGDGVLLRSLDCVKPNVLEAGELAGAGEGAGFFQGKGSELASGAAKALILKGIPLVYISMGKNGVLRRCAGGAVIVRPPLVETVSATGAGDAFLAGALWQRLTGFACEAGEGDTADLAAGCAAAAITLEYPGAVNPAMSGRLLVLRELETAGRLEVGYTGVQGE